MSFIDLPEEDVRWLVSISDYVKKRPHVSGYVGEAVSSGVLNRIHEMRDHKADIETVMAMSLSLLYGKKFKGIDALILDKLENIQDECSLNIRHIIKDIKNKIGGE